MQKKMNTEMHGKLHGAFRNGRLRPSEARLRRRMKICPNNNEFSDCTGRMQLACISAACFCRGMSVSLRLGAVWHCRLSCNFVRIAGLTTLHGPLYSKATRVGDSPLKNGGICRKSCPDAQ